MSDPAVNKVPTKIQGTAYHLVSLDLNALNRVLHDLGLRLNQLDAIGQYPDMKGQRLVNLAPGAKSSDSVRFDQTQIVYYQEGFGIELVYFPVTRTLLISVMQQTHITDANAISSLSLGAGSDQVDRAGFNAKLSTLRTEINAIKNKLNNVIQALETAEILAAS